MFASFSMSTGQRKSSATTSETFTFTSAGKFGAASTRRVLALTNPGTPTPALRIGHRRSLARSRRRSTQWRTPSRTTPGSSPMAS